MRHVPKGVAHDIVRIKVAPASRCAHRCGKKGNVPSTGVDLEQPLRLDSGFLIGGIMTDDDFIAAYRRLDEAGRSRLEAILKGAQTEALLQLPAGTQTLHGKDEAGEFRPHLRTAALR